MSPRLHSNDLLLQRVELAVLRGWDRSRRRVREAREQTGRMVAALEGRPDAELVRRILPGLVEHLQVMDPVGLSDLLRRAGLAVGDDSWDAVQRCREELPLVDPDVLVRAVAGFLEVSGPARTRSLADRPGAGIDGTLGWLTAGTREALVELAGMPPGRDGRGRVVTFVGPAGSGKRQAAGWLAQQWRRRGAVTADSAVIVSGLVPSVSASVLFAYHNTWRTLSALSRQVVLVTGISNATEGGYLATSEDLAGLLEMLTSPAGPTLVIAARNPLEASVLPRAVPDLAGLCAPSVRFPELEPAALVRAVPSLGALRLTSPTADAVETMVEALGELRGLPGWAGLHTARRLQSAVRASVVRRSGSELSQADSSDVRAALQMLAPRPAGEDLTLLLAELDGFAGAEGAKDAVADLLALHEENRRRLTAGRKALDGSSHMLLLGPPGTGKTTFARLLGRIAHAAGILSRPDVTEVGRADLIAGYVGQTALRTRAVIESAAGGVLLIDEAYSLRPSSGSDFAAEALAVLVAEMENRRDSFLVVLAGYEEPTLRLLDENRGLASRIGHHVRFPALSIEQRLDLFSAGIAALGYPAAPGVTEAARRALTVEIGTANDGNARTVRQMVTQVAARRARRLGSSDPDGPVIPDDVANRAASSDVPAPGLYL